MEYNKKKKKKESKNTKNIQQVLLHSWEKKERASIVPTSETVLIRFNTNVV